mmetsp:Transcript_666/g.1461  ORF Transcript_666/g.1461 Transcript_666/m.1461 type:complete len:216 (-) Transcript_666:390-1037(-)
MLFLLRKLNVLLRVLFRSPMHALQKSEENSRLGFPGKPGTHSRRRTAPVNPDDLIRLVSSPMRPAPAPDRTEAKMGTRFWRALGTTGRGSASAGSDSSSSSSLLSLAEELMVINIETGSSPISSEIFPTRASISSSFHEDAVESLTVISGIGCNPHSKAVLHNFNQSVSSSPEISSIEEISEPSLIDTKIPETPVSATSGISSTSFAASSFPAPQ